MKDLKTCPKKIVGCLLAAGSSERMGKTNKLLFEFNGITMVRKIAVEMVNSNLDDCFAVVGYQSDKVAKALSGLPIELIKNNEWRSGQGKSISKMAERLDDSNTDLLIMLGDLPGVKRRHFNCLIESHKDTKNSEFAITIPEYKGLKGNPVIWGESYINQLKTLSGDTGGRIFFKNYTAEINSVEINSDCILSDVDTLDCLQQFL